MSEVVTELRGGVGLITLNRPKALNALSLAMIRDLSAALLAWRDDAAIHAVAIRGQGREGPFGAFCAGGDIRFFHVAALAGNPELEEFFNDEYALDHLIHRYPKPFVAFMDGIVMGGGMGLSQGAALRIVTERTRMAMPETGIGLFPDVGGGYFLGRCPGRIGEYLALTGAPIGAGDAIAAGLADVAVRSGALPELWEQLSALPRETFPAALREHVAANAIGSDAPLVRERSRIDRFFDLPGVVGIIGALEADPSAWAAQTASLLRKRSPLMLHVTLEQLRRGRTMGLADDLRMERDLMHRCFQLRGGTSNETLEGIRAVVVDKDADPHWNPARIEDVAADMVSSMFDSPWRAETHPLRHLVG